MQKKSLLQCRNEFVQYNLQDLNELETLISILPRVNGLCKV